MIGKAEETESYLFHKKDNLKHTLDSIYLSSILEVQKLCMMVVMIICNVQTNENHPQDIIYPDYLQT